MAHTVLVELSNPQTQQAAMTADLDLRTAKDNSEVLKADLERDLLAQRAAAAGVTADAAQAAMNADADEQMAKNGFISAIQLRRSRLLAETAAARQKMEEQRLANSERTLALKLSVQQSEVRRRETMPALRRSEATGLKIRAGVAGVLQEVPVQGGAAYRPGHEPRSRRRSDEVEGTAERRLLDRALLPVDLAAARVDGGQNRATRMCSPGYPPRRACAVRRWRCRRRCGRPSRAACGLRDVLRRRQASSM